MCSKPIKLRRPPPLLVGDSVESLVSKRAKPEESVTKAERFFVGDGRLQKVMDAILGQCGFSSDLIDLISTMEIDYITQPCWVFDGVTPPTRQCITVNKHHSQFDLFVEHVLGTLAHISHDDLLRWSLRGSVYISISFDNNIKKLTMTAMWPLSRSVLYQLLNQSQRTILKKWQKPQYVPEMPILWIDYQDDAPHTVQTFKAGFPSIFAKHPDMHNPFPCQLCQEEA